MSIVDTVLHKIFGTPHERKVKQLRPVIAQIHAARQALEALDDAALAAEKPRHQVKLKNAHKAPVQTANDRQNLRNGIHTTFLPFFRMLIAFPD